jgi:vancomycin aglycone glucosyltransferase
MRALLVTYGSRGDVEPMVALAVQVRELGADVRVCAPPDEELAALLAAAGVPVVAFDRPWRSWQRPSTPEERTRRVAEFIDAQYDTVAAAAEGCDVLLATAMSHFVAQSVAELAAIPNRYVLFAPSVLNDLDAQNWNALFGPAINDHRASLDLSPVEDVGAFMFTDRPWLAADPTLGPWEGRRSSPSCRPGRGSSRTNARSRPS